MLGLVYSGVFHAIALAPAGSYLQVAVLLLLLLLTLYFSSSAAVKPSLIVYVFVSMH
jgi:hypothetical protein